MNKIQYLSNIKPNPKYICRNVKRSLCLLGLVCVILNQLVWCLQDNKRERTRSLSLFLQSLSKKTHPKYQNTQKGTQNNLLLSFCIAEELPLQLTFVLYAIAYLYFS